MSKFGNRGLRVAQGLEQQAKKKLEAAKPKKKATKKKKAE